MEKSSLQNEPVLKMLIKLIVPSFITIIVSSSYSIVDGIFIGKRFGIAGNNSFSYIFIIYSLVFSIACLICQGAPSLLAIKMGENDVDGAEQVLGASIWSSIVLSIIQAIVVYLGLGFMIRLLVCDEAYIDYVVQYFQIFLFFAPIYFVNHTLVFCLRSQGNVKLVFFCNVGSCLVNVILDPIFILGFDWGFRGAALATIIANLMSMLFCIWCYTRKKASAKIRLKYIRFRFKETKEMIGIGMASFLMNLLYSIILVAYNRIAKYYGGTYGIACMGINATLYKYLVVITNSITVGMQPVICYNFGGKKYDRVITGLKDSLLIGVAIALVCYVVIMVGAESVISLFNSDPDFIPVGARSLKLVELCFPLQVFFNIGTAFFQYIDKGKIAAGFVFLRQVIIQIPVAFLLSSRIGVDGLWSSFWIADLGSFLVLLVFLLRIVQQYRKERVVSDASK